jgi:exonuclease III
MDKIRICSLNCRGLRDKWKRNTVFKYFKNNKFDIICLQETHVLEREKLQWEKEWGGSIFAQEGTSRSKGEVILISRLFKEEIEVLITEERILAINIRFDQTAITIVNVYAPNDSLEKKSFFHNLHLKLKDVVCENVILCGDFNCVLKNKCDVIAGHPFKRAEVEAFQRSVQELSLTDIWRALHQDELDYTWNRFHPFVARRLDYCFVTEDILPLIACCEHYTVPSSDHKAVVLELENGKFIRGPAYCRFNNSYLKNDHFVNDMNALLDKLKHDNDLNLNPVDRWELTKCEIRNYCVDFGKRLACNQRNKKIELQKHMHTLELAIVKYPESIYLQNELLRIKHKLELLDMQKAKGAQIRSRIRWIEEGEKSTKYFCNLEKTRQRKNVMTRLVSESVNVISNQEEILAEQVRLYSNLYDKQTEVEDVAEATHKFIANENFTRLDDNSSKSCEGLVTIDESSHALSTMKNGSAPGMDGITFEFMKFFWNKLKHMVTDSFNESFHRNELSYTQYQGVITLIHKGKELDRDHLTNWRPITLTNTDYKVLAKVMAHRLSGVIQQLVSEDQVGYMKGRNIATVIRTIDDVIDYVNKTGKAGCILALDFSKAFDSISNKYLLQTFDVLGFGPDFKRWIKVMMKSSVSHINYGGWISDSFSINCGIRQGCPLSPLIFVLAVELLAIKIRNSDIIGIQVPHKNNTIGIKIQQMADDTTLFLKDQNDIVMAI